MLQRKHFGLSDEVPTFQAVHLVRVEVVDDLGGGHRQRRSGGSRRNELALGPDVLRAERCRQAETEEGRGVSLEQLFDDRYLGDVLSLSLRFILSDRARAP